MSGLENVGAAVENYLKMSNEEYSEHMGEDIKFEEGILRLDYDSKGDNKILRFFTWEELNIIKQAWRERRNWHPVDNLIDLIDFSKPYYIPMGVFKFKKGA